MKRLLESLGRAQARHPLRFVIGALIVTLVCAPIASQLALDGDLTALLPEDGRSVRDLRAMAERFGSRQTFTMVVRSNDSDAMHAFTRDLVPDLEALRERGVIAIDWNLEDYGTFVEQHRHLYAPLEDLEAVSDALDRRVRYEQARASPFEVWLDDEPGDELERLYERLQREEEEGRTRLTRRYPHGFFEHPDGTSVVILMRTDTSGATQENMLGLIETARRIVEARDPTSYAPDLRVDFGGGALEMHEEQEVLVRAAVLATGVTLALVMLAIFAFFRRPRAVLILPLGLVPALAATFAVAELSVDFLNASSAFLSSIVIGNGINAHIIWLARWFELRRRGDTIEDAVVEAHRSTWAATLAAALAAGLAYASLTVTDFRAFRDFGIIGGVGMLFTWVAATTFTPALAVLWERWRPIARAKRGASTIFGTLLVAPLRAPRVILGVSVVLTLLAVVSVVGWVRADPLEYDFRNMQSQRPEGPLQRINRRIGDSVDQTTGGAAIAVMTATPDDVPRVLEQLERNERESYPLFNALRSVHDLLPPDQEAKLPLLRAIREHAVWLRDHADDDVRELVDRYLPPEDVRALTAEDLPETVARPFVERDGTRGSVLYAEASNTQSQTDGHFLLAWTAACRAPENSDGSPVAAAGAAPIVADLVAAIQSDGPRAVLLAFLATVLLLIVTFRKTSSRLLTLASHLVGIVWMVGLMAAFGMKINFLNFVALPITFGNGVDYGVNLMRRYLQEKGPDAVLDAVRQTGGAVMLCSVTTIIGYIALYTSPNQALNSFGTAMAISEVTCVATALIALPAVLQKLQPSSPTSGT